MSFDSIEDALKAYSQGVFVIVCDDQDRENEGDLMIAAEKVTPSDIAFMVRYTTGIICVPMEAKRLRELDIPPMVVKNTAKGQTSFTVPVDCRHSTTTGVSAEDRAATIRSLLDSKAKPDDFLRPGHIFPLIYNEGGVLARPGHTESAVDLAKICGLYPAGVLCELVNDDGSMMRGPDLHKFAKEHQLPIITVQDIIEYRRANESQVTRVSSARLPTKHGSFQGIVYTSKLNNLEHLALVKGEVAGKEGVLVRVHSECITGDVFDSFRCDCGLQKSLAMELIQKEEEGILIHLRGHEGRGIGLAAKFRAYELQDQGLDTVEANLELGHPVDIREYSIAAQILKDMGVVSVRLLTNNPDKSASLAKYKVRVEEQVPLLPEISSENQYTYLQTKKEKLGHSITFSPLTGTYTK